MARRTTPLNPNLPMVDPKSGTPSPFFLRWWQDQVRTNASIAESLGGLSDVNVPSPTADQVLAWNAISSLWEAVSPTLDFLSDVDVPAPVDNDVLFWNDGTGAWEAGDAGSVSPSMDQAQITSSTYTVVDADFLTGKTVKLVNTVGGCTVSTVSGLTNKEPLTFIQKGAGIITFNNGVGTTILSADGRLVTRVQYSAATLIPDLITANQFYLVGDIA